MISKLICQYEHASVNLTAQFIIVNIIMQVAIGSLHATPQVPQLQKGILP